jgi:LysR family glycine cleavage system transcriptional activator
MATQELQRAERVNSVTISATTGFSTYWLMPRIGEFRKCHPKTDLRFMISDRYLDLALEDIDLAIRYGTGDWPGLRATFLLQERIFPVCSKNYFAGRKRLQEPHELLQETLLHLEGRYDSQTRWLTWFRDHGLEVEDSPQGIRVNTYTNLVQATLESQGISLIGPPLIQKYLDDGELVRPLEIAATLRRAFYLVTPQHQDLALPATIFCDWIKEVANSETHSGG